MMLRLLTIVVCAATLGACKSDDPWNVPSAPDLEASNYDITTLGCNESTGSGTGSGGGGDGEGGEGGGGAGNNPGEPCGGTLDRGGVTGGLFFGGGVAVNCGGGGGGAGMMGGAGGASGGNGEFGGGGGPGGAPGDPLPGGIMPDIGQVFVGDALDDLPDLGVGDAPDIGWDVGELCCFTEFCEEIDDECPFVCGDGVVDEPETCDGDCDSIVCPEPPVCDLITSYVRVGEPSLCAVECVPATGRACELDGCCPEFCNYTNDEDCDVITGGVGSACDEDSDCGDAAEGHFCVSEGYRAGYCSFNWLEAAGACPVGSHITNIWILTGHSPDVMCAADCESDDECGGRVGYGCIDLDFDGVTECVQVGIGDKPFGAECQDTTQCAGGEYALCDGFAPLSEFEASCGFVCEEDGAVECPADLHCLGNRCYEACSLCIDDDGCCPVELGCSFEVDNDCPEPSDDVVGRPCVSSADCGDPLATCLTPEDGFPGGYCTYEVGDLATCPEGSNFVFVSGRDQVSCRENCETNAECRGPDYECYDSTSTLSEQLFCSPVANGAAPLGGSCERLDQCAGGRYVFCDDSVCTKRCVSDGLGVPAVPCPGDLACSILTQICREPCPDGDCPPGYDCFPALLDNPAICEPSDG